MMTLWLPADVNDDAEDDRAICMREACVLSADNTATDRQQV